MLRLAGAEEDVDNTTFVIVCTEEAWSAKAAVEAARDREAVLRSAGEVVAVPQSSWHVFKPTTTFEEVK